MNHKIEHSDFEKNIHAILDDDEDDVKAAPQSQISVDNLSNTKEKAGVNEITKKVSNLQVDTSKKLSAGSSSFSPNKTKGKRVKLRNLRKPQSQKEPTITNPRDFGPPNQQMYAGSHIVDNPQYRQTHGLAIDDHEVATGSNMYSNIDRSTTSSAGSGNYYGDMQGYGQNMGHYLQPGYNMYHQGYYPPQQYHPNPAFAGPHGMIPRQASAPGYDGYVNSPNMVPPNLASSHSALETISSCGSVYSETGSTYSQNQRQAPSLRSPMKQKRGFRKVKSTNEKSLPIDPAARELILLCDKEPNVMKKLELLKGQLEILIYNQSGSRFLQKFLTKANKEIIEFFLAEIDSSVNKLMMDKYGNYF
jgi:hypothetical protein